MRLDFRNINVKSEVCLSCNFSCKPENSTTKNHIEFDRTPSQQTALQLAAEANLAEVCSILLSEGIDFSAMDSR